MLLCQTIGPNYFACHACFFASYVGVTENDQHYHLVLMRRLEAVCGCNSDFVQPNTFGCIQNDKKKSVKGMTTNRLSYFTALNVKLKSDWFM